MAVFATATQYGVLLEASTKLHHGLDQGWDHGSDHRSRNREFLKKKIVNIIIICKIISEKSKIWWLKLEMLHNSQNKVCDLMECRFHCKFLHSKTPCSHLQTAESRSAV